MKNKRVSFYKSLSIISEVAYQPAPLGWVLLTLLCLLSLTGCQSSGLLEVTPTIIDTVNIESPTVSRTPSLTPSETPGQTDTPIPTDTPISTDTPTPSDTPIPTDTPTPTTTALPEGVELVNLRTSDGVDLVGFLHRPVNFPERNLVVVLAHGYTQSTREWNDFEELLIENGFTIMTFDFRGHGASSGGAHQWATLGIDVKTVLDYVKRQGFERIVCVGSSMGGTGCLAASLDTDITGLVLLSSTMNPLAGPRLVMKSDVQNLTIPKIFMIAEEDIFGPEGVENFNAMVEIAGEPKYIYRYPGSAHGSGLFYEEYGEQVLKILLDFLIDISK